jgi:hypothetical protein
MKLNRSVSAIAIVFGLALQAFAQDPPKEESGPTFDDLKKDLGDLKAKQDKEENDRRDAQVQRNMEETLRIYGEVLNGKGTDAANVDKRLKTNQTLAAKYARLLESARAELARLRSAYVTRTLTLKKSLDEKKISAEAYDKLLDEDTRKYRNREKELVDDIVFYESEHATASKLNKDLGVKKELLEFDPFQAEDADKVAADARPAPKTTLADRLQKKVWGLSGYRTKSVVDAID